MADESLNPKINDAAPKPTERSTRSIIQELESIPGRTIEDDPFTYSNDLRIEGKVPRIVDRVQNIKGPLKVAVIVSNGGLWTIPPLLNVDLVIRINMNSNQLTQDREREQEILSADDPQELMPVPDEAVDKDNITAARHERFRMEGPIVEMESYGQYHYMASKENLARTQAFLREGKIAYVGGDLTDAEFMKHVGDVIRDHDGTVVFADLTNVMGWVGGYHSEEKKEQYRKALTQLPFNERAIILHSYHTGLAGRSPILTNLNDLEGYFRFPRRGMVSSRRT